MEEKQEEKQISEFKGKMPIVWLIGILVILLGCTVVYIIKNSKGNNKFKEAQPVQQSVQPEVQSAVTEQEQTLVEKKSNANEELETENKKTEQTKTESKKESNNNVKINGTYKAESKTKNYYYSSQLIISDQTSNSIDFSIMAAHGSDVGHVNVGEVSGTAKKTNIPKDLVAPDSIQYAYEFVDEVDNKINKIIIVYTNFKKFEFVDIIEEYAGDRNPYAGEGVYFKGDYERIK